MPATRPDNAERMLAAAAKLFGAKRFHEVRMEDIAAEAGVGKGTLYRYFADKDELFLALLRHAGDRLTRRVHCRAAAAGCPVGKLEAVVGAVVEFFDEEPHVFDLIQRAEVIDRDHWRPVRDDIMHLVQQILADEVRVAEPESAMLLLLGGVRAHIRFAAKPRPADLARRLVAMTLHGAVTRPALA